MPPTATAAPEIYTPEQLAELSDAELKGIADGDGEQAGLARDVLSERDARFGEKTGDGKAESLRREAGEPVGAMPPATPDGGALPEPDEIIVDGSCELTLFDFGGKKPTGATLRLTGGSVKIAAGQGYPKGSRLQFSGEAIVNDVGGKDEHDTNTSQVVDCKARFGARIVDLQIDSAAPPS